jgi:hypothetical protein
MNASMSKPVFASFVAAVVLLGGQLTWAGNLPTWGGATTTNEPQQVQQPRPLVSQPAPITAQTVKPPQPGTWTAPGTTVTPTVTPTVKTPVRQLQTRPAETVVTGTRWADWSELAWEATKAAVNTRWIMQATIQNVRINGPTAIGTPGCLQGPDLAPIIRTYMLTNEAPPEVADVYANSVGGAWKAWQDYVTIPGLPWYPAFAAWPGPQAPPTPNIPTPLIALLSSRKSELTSPQQMTARITARLSEAGLASQEASAELQRFSQQITLSFLTWLSSAQVHLVLGQGPVPTFAPPPVPTGPVVGGMVIPRPGIIIGNLR